MNQGILYLNAGGKILSANPAAARILGLALADLPGKTLDELAIERSAPGGGNAGRIRWVGVEAEPHFREGETMPCDRIPMMIGLFDPAWRRQWRDRRTLETCWINIRLSGGRTLRNISERKRREEQLRRCEARFRKLFDSSVIGILISNTRGDITEANDAFLEMIGYTRDDLSAGRVRWKDMTPPEYGRLDEEAIAAMLRSGRFPAFEKEYVRRDGSRVPVLLGGVLLDFESTETLCFVLDLTERKRAEAELETSHNRLRSLAARLERVREEERTRVAREIHDDLGQMLTALKMDLRALERANPRAGPLALKRIRAMAEHLDSGIDAVKRITAELRPAVLDHLGLIAAIEWQASDFQARTSIACSIEEAPEEAGATPEQATAIFRILQEALTNVTRHAEASRVEIRVGKGPKRLWMEVADNGIGIDPGKMTDPESLGLWGMRERAAALGGQFGICRGACGRGTTLSVSIPASVIGEERP